MVDDHLHRRRLTPQPGDSLTVRFTPPRAGTFMYHSHFNEMQQTASGLYGPIVVLEPGETFDPETDRVLVLSDGGPWKDLPPALATVRPAQLSFLPGEIHDFEFTPDAAGELVLAFGKGEPETFTRVPVRVD